MIGLGSDKNQFSEMVKGVKGGEFLHAYLGITLSPPLFASLWRDRSSGGHEEPKEMKNDEQIQSTNPLDLEQPKYNKTKVKLGGKKL